MTIAGHYRLKHILERIDRKKSTVLRWEAAGLIPEARRDSRGWRYYSEEEVNAIVKKVYETDYFREYEILEMSANNQQKVIPETAVPAWELQTNGQVIDQWVI